ncbi:MAG: flagellar protein FlaG [Lachnospiraceae bacterium]
MAIEGIKSSVMTQQVNRVEKTATPVEVTDAASARTATQGYIPVTEAQSSNNKNEQKDGKEQENGQDLQDVSPEKVKSALSDINKRIRPTHTQCEFKYHEETHRISITVRDSDTNKVIKEIPPEKTLDMIAKSLELAGILVDEKR